MKKQHFSALFAVTLLFIGFILGFLAGRNTVREPVIVSVPEAMMQVPDAPAQTEAAFSYPIDLNTASKDALLSLPGIGETLADRILAYRRERGKFQSTADLLKVEGISDKRLRDLLGLITVGG